MRLTRKAALLGLASFALAGGAAAAAPEPVYHAMEVALPNGGTAIIEYTGDVPPRVEVGSAPAREVLVPVLIRRSVYPAPFMMLDRIAAAMQARAAAMMERMALAARAPGFASPRLDLAAGSALPAAALGYSMVSQVTSDGVCTRRTTVTRDGADKAPQVVTETSGDCAASGTSEGAAERPAASGAARADAVAPRTI